MTIAVLAGVLIGTVNFSTITFAAKPSDPDCWGEESAEQAQTGTQGEHASNPDEDLTKGNDNSEDPGPEDNQHRSGIGNVGGEGSETHPSDVGEILNEGACEED